MISFVLDDSHVARARRPAENTRGSGKATNATQSFLYTFVVVALSSYNFNIINLLKIGVSLSISCNISIDMCTMMYKELLFIYLMFCFLDAA